MGLLQASPEELYRALAAGVQTQLEPFPEGHYLCWLQTAHLESPKEPERAAILHSACAEKQHHHDFMP